jgi:hypothetical protein
MTKISVALGLLLILAVCLEARSKKWASARERGLRGKVHILNSSCGDMKGSYETKVKYEFARNGELTKTTAPTPPNYDCILTIPTSLKVTQRNARGDVSEVARSLEGDVIEKERYEYEYDEVGNWIKQTTFLMRTYEMVGGDWKEGEWQAKYLCNRSFEYYR